MAKINDNKNFLLAIWLAIFFALPLTSLAAPVQIGSACVPDDPTKDQTCQYCAQKNSHEVMHLKWQISDAHYVHPYCVLACSRTDGSPCPSIYNKDDSGLANYRFNALDAIASGNLDGFNLKPTDDILIKDMPISGFAVGNIYQAQCCELSDHPIIGQWCKDQPGPLNSGQMAIVGCGQACEVPFSTITNALNNYQPAIITEENFKNWAIPPTDDANKVLGSGDKADIIAAMKQKMCMLYGPPESWPTILPGPDVNSYFGTKDMAWYYYYLSRNFAVPISIFWRDSTTPTYDYHSMIAVGIASQGTNIYDINVIDPNGPGYRTLRKCQVAQFQSSPGVFISVYRCDFDYGDKLNKVYLYYDYGTDITLFTALFDKRVRDNTAGFIIDNYPDIDNGNPEITEKGLCMGWTDFVMRVAYLGAFVGYDYHPGDGKTIGADCDINHYPGQKTSRANPQNWLATLTNVWLATLTNIWNIFKK